SPERMFLVRHGQDQDNAEGRVNGRRDRPLTELGKQQARKAAEKLKDKNITTIYTSPLQRASETVQFIADVTGIKGAIVHDGLIERDWGVFTGRRTEEVLRYAKEHQSPTLETTDGKTVILEAEGQEEADIIKRISPIAWRNVNFLGRFEFQQSQNPI